MTKRTRKSAKTRVVVPSEDYETKCFVNWLQRQKDTGLIQQYSHLPLEARSRAQRIKNHALGTRPGVPDFLIVLPGPRFLFVEMKRVRGGRVSAEQKRWLEAIGEYGKVCRGAQEAISFVECFMLRAEQPARTASSEGQNG